MDNAESLLRTSKAREDSLHHAPEFLILEMSVEGTAVISAKHLT